jgi:hypothetical protein
MPLTYFSLWMTRLMGLLPDIAHCTACGEALAAGETSFNTLGDGLFCAAHRGGNASGLSADSWQLAQRMLRAPAAAFAAEPGRAAAGRTCAASPCRLWNGTWSANCARRRRWGGWEGENARDLSLISQTIMEQDSISERYEPTASPGITTAGLRANTSIWTRYMVILHVLSNRCILAYENQRQSRRRRPPVCRGLRSRERDYPR